MQNRIATALLIGMFALLGFATAWIAERPAHAAQPTAANRSLPEFDKDEDEFYARVDAVDSPTELTVTVLDAWRPMDKVQGPRWPNGIAKVKPVKRTVVLEELSGPSDAEQRKSAMDFIRRTLKESDHEVICTGSGISVKKGSGGEMISITAYVYVKKGFTLNNAMVSHGWATTSNPFYREWQEAAKRKKLGIWRDRQ
jgi:hypothetical protein